MRVILRVILTCVEIQFDKRTFLTKGTGVGSIIPFGGNLRVSDDDNDNSPPRKYETYVSFHARPAIFPFSKVDLVQHAAE